MKTKAFLLAVALATLGTITGLAQQQPAAP